MPLIFFIEKQKYLSNDFQFPLFSAKLISKLQEPFENISTKELTSKFALLVTCEENCSIANLLKIFRDCWDFWILLSSLFREQSNILKNPLYRFVPRCQISWKSKKPLSRKMLYRHEKNRKTNGQQILITFFRVSRETKSYQHYIKVGYMHGRKLLYESL